MLLNNLFATALLGATTVVAAGLQQVTNFGTNPTGTQMYVYVPAKVAAKPAILLGVSRFPG
jgi:acetylxylan esterase